MSNVLSPEERQQLLDMYSGLRVADISDGMDWNMLHDLGLVDRRIGPLARGMGFVGLAKTVRYIPPNQNIPAMTPDEYSDYVGYWYSEVCPYPIGDVVEQGDVICVDASNLDAGLLGSENVLRFVNQGAVGVVTNGGCRDTDEVIAQGCAVFSRWVSRTMVQGRLQFSDMMNPVDLGGVQVRPCDIVAADGDGVIVVPLEKAEQVAKYARRELSKDKAARRRLYEQAGKPLDDSVT